MFWIQQEKVRYPCHTEPCRSQSTKKESVCRSSTFWYVLEAFLFTLFMEEVVLRYLQVGQLSTLFYCGLSQSLLFKQNLQKQNEWLQIWCYLSNICGENLDTFQLDPGILVLGPLAKAMGRLNPVADTGLALGIGMARESPEKKTWGAAWEIWGKELFGYRSGWVRKIVIPQDIQKFLVYKVEHLGDYYPYMMELWFFFRLFL